MSGPSPVSSAAVRPESRRPPRLAALLAISLLTIAAVLPAGTAAASKSYRLDVSGPGDFVRQTNFVQCVGASMQMMLNMIGADDDRSATTQRHLQTLARGLSGKRPDGRIREGASVRGWAAGLTYLGAAHYRVAGATTIDEALHMAAEAIRDTGKPVGLLMWRGRHAWVMSGFTATADPRRTDDFMVTQAVVLDPLYPFGSKVWGRSPRPRESLTVAELGTQFVPRRSDSMAAQWLSGFGGQYVIVMPYRPTLVPRDGRLPH